MSCCSCTNYSLMKKFIISAALFTGLFVAACNSSQKEEREMQDSITKAAKADSMLQEALRDTLVTDTSKTDSIFPDSLKK